MGEVTTDCQNFCSEEAYSFLSVHEGQRRVAPHSCTKKAREVSFLGPQPAVHLPGPSCPLLQEWEIPSVSTPRRSDNISHRAHTPTALISKMSMKFLTTTFTL